MHPMVPIIAVVPIPQFSPLPTVTSTNNFLIHNMLNVLMGKLVSNFCGNLTSNVYIDYR